MSARRTWEDRLAQRSPYLGMAALPALAVWAYLAYQAPLEKTLGLVYKILYVHVPCVIPTYLGFALAAVGGMGFLRTREPRWDRLALAGAEVGVVFCSLMVMTGMIWAKPAWGAWWAWEPRLTSTAVLWFIYLAYLFVRAFATGSDSARTAAAVHAVIGVLVIPFVYFAVDLAQDRGMHPSREPMPPEFRVPLLAGFAAFTLIFFYLLGQRLELARLEDRALANERA
jgi:heme exporter protein C